MAVTCLARRSPQGETGSRAKRVQVETTTERDDSVRAGCRNARTLPDVWRSFTKRDRPIGGSQFRLDEHVQLVPDCSWTGSRQLIEVMHHVHLVVVLECVGDVCPSHLRRRRPEAQSRLESNDPGIALRRDPDLVAEPSLELSCPEPRTAVRDRTREHIRCAHVFPRRSLPCRQSSRSPDVSRTNTRLRSEPYRQTTSHRQAVARALRAVGRALIRPRSGRSSAPLPAGQTKRTAPRLGRRS